MYPQPGVTKQRIPAVHPPVDRTASAEYSTDKPVVLASQNTWAIHQAVVRSVHSATNARLIARV